MKLGFSGANTQATSFEEDLELAAGSGYEGIEGWVPKLWAVLEHRAPAELRTLRARRHLPVWALAPIPEATFRDQVGMDEVSAAVHRLAEAARHLGAPWLVLWPGDLPDGADERDGVRVACETLVRLCRISERYDVGLALMPLGTPRASIRTLRHGAQVIESAHRPSISLALDTFHFHAEGSTVEDLKRCHPRWLALLRIADAPERRAGERVEAQRLPPGEGVVSFAAIASTLDQLGADPPAVAHVPFEGPAGEAEGWARQLRARALAVLASPAPSRM